MSAIEINIGVAEIVEDDESWDVIDLQNNPYSHVGFFAITGISHSKQDSNIIIGLTTDAETEKKAIEVRCEVDGDIRVSQQYPDNGYKSLFSAVEMAMKMVEQMDISQKQPVVA